MSYEALPWLSKGNRSVQDLAYWPAHSSALQKKTWRYYKFIALACVSDCEAELGVSGCSRIAGQQMRLGLVLHNGAEFDHMTRPTGVVTHCSKKVCTMSSGNAVFITRPDWCVALCLTRVTLAL